MHFNYDSSGILIIIGKKPALEHGGVVNALDVMDIQEVMAVMLIAKSLETQQQIAVRATSFGFVIAEKVKIRGIINSILCRTQDLVTKLGWTTRIFASLLSTTDILSSSLVIIARPSSFGHLFRI